MSQIVFRCNQIVCADVREPAPWCCQHCTNLFSERVADVYRPHRRAVMQALWGNTTSASRLHMPRVFLQARLGCPDARAWVRRRKRLANGTCLGRWSWSRRPRGVKLSQLSFPARLALAIRYWAMPHAIVDESGDLPESYLGTGVV
jgi:hypothetical protein